MNKNSEQARRWDSEMVSMLRMTGVKGHEQIRVPQSSMHLGAWGEVVCLFSETRFHCRVMAELNLHYRPG